MEKHGGSVLSQLIVTLHRFLRICLFIILAVGPIPNHIAFIMDGNRRYAKKRNLVEGDGHKAGFNTLTSLLRYCFELGVMYVTVYAFSIENFKRKPKEVEDLMTLLQEKIEELIQQKSIVHEYGIRLHFVGNLKLLSHPVRVSVEKAMKATAKNDKRVLLICIAYASRDEIVHAVEEACKNKWRELSGNKNYVQEIVPVQNHGSFEDTATRRIDPNVGAEKNKANEIEVLSISEVDIEKHLYMSVAPDPDIVIRSSGETRLSNFLLWQTSTCPLYSPSALWPELGLWHLVWAVLNFQKSYPYIEKKKKQF